MGQGQTLPEGWRLRVGRAQTPEEAKEELAAFKEATPDLASWEKRKAAIRQGMLEALRLTTFPKSRRLTRFIRTSEPRGLHGRERAYPRLAWLLYHGTRIDR